MLMQWVSMLALSFAFLVYLLIGGAVFMTLEADNEESARLAVREFKTMWRKDFNCVDENAMEGLIAAAVTAIDNGVSPVQNATSPMNWDYSSSFFFAGTVVTTIGYGESVPRTFWGRNAVIIYALIGIPLTGWTLSTIGNHWEATFRKKCKRISQTLPRKTPRWARRLLQVLTVGLMSWFVFVIVPALIFMYLEGWDFYIAHYYTFVTLSTIGFGDFVASRDLRISERYQWVYDVTVAIWYIFGLSYLSVVIAAITKQQHGNLKKVKLFSKKLRKRSRADKERYLLEKRPQRQQLWRHKMSRSLSIDSGLSALDECCVVRRSRIRDCHTVSLSIACERHGLQHDEQIMDAETRFMNETGSAGQHNGDLKPKLGSLDT